MWRSVSSVPAPLTIHPNVVPVPNAGAGTSEDVDVTACGNECWDALVQRRPGRGGGAA